jgi:drug/metabolite transporter (DMT)-like permease
VLTDSPGATRSQLGLVLPRPSPRGVAIASLLAGAAFFGASTVASKAALDHLPPVTLAFARFAIALVVLLLLCRRAGVRPVYGRLPAVLGVTGITLPFVCQNVGLQFATAVDTTLIIEGVIPIATAILAAALLGERLTGRRLIGLLLSVAGVGAVVLHGAAGRTGFDGLGSLLAFGAAVSFAVYTVVGRRLFGGNFSLSVLTGSIAIGVLLLAPCAAVEIAVSGPGTISPSAGLLLLYLGVGGSAGTQLLWARGMAGLEAAEVAVFGTLMPVVGVAAANVFLSEPITFVQVGGGLVVGVGLYLTARLTHPAPAAPPRASIDPAPTTRTSQSRTGRGLLRFARDRGLDPARRTTPRTPGIVAAGGDRSPGARSALWSAVARRNEVSTPVRMLFPDVMSDADDRRRAGDVPPAVHVIAKGEPS